jgi:hypothetical protein
MRKFIIPAILVASLGLSSVAMAAASHVSTGVVKAVDLKGETVTIGKTEYHFAAKFDLSSIKVGEKVDVTWHPYKKIDVGTKIVASVAKAAPMKPVAKPMAKTMAKTMTKTVAPK